MRTIKFLGFAVALAAVTVPAFAQGGLQPGTFPNIDRLARMEARRLEHRQLKHQFRGQRVAARVGKGQRFQRGPRFGAGVAAGVHGGVKAGTRAGLRANATPEQQAFFEARQAQLKAMHAQVTAGTLTREQARTQMHAWVTEHRPKK